MVPAFITWALIAYVAASCAGVWAYSALRIVISYHATVQTARVRMTKMSAYVDAQIAAMLDDGVGASLTALSDTERAGKAPVSDAQLTDALRRGLTGGLYVRSLFLATPARFVRVGRAGTSRSDDHPPSWLEPALLTRTRAAWIGAPMKDPDGTGRTVIPVARSAGTSARGVRDAWAGALFDFGGLGGFYEPSLQLPSVTLLTGNGTPIAGTPPSQWHPARGDIVAYGPVPGYPMSVAALERREVALAPWYQQLRDTLPLTAALTLLLIGTAWMFNHFIRTLGRRELHYRTLFNNAAFGAFVLEGERFVEANRTSATMFGITHPDELMGLGPGDLSPPLQPDGSPSKRGARERIHQALASGSVTYEWVCQRLDDGKPFRAEVDLSSLEADGQTLTLAVIHDVTERSRLDEEREHMLAELHELAGTLVHLQDDERRRIGRDLHDTTGQTLATLELKLAQLQRLSQRFAPAVRRVLEECCELAQQASTEIRTASYLLHPPLLDEIGLLSALKWLADGLRQRSDIRVDLELPASMGRLPREQELAFFRVAQEALTNVHRHSASPSATIRLFESGDRLILEVEDAGRGLLAEPTSGPVENVMALGVGLAGMRERMRQLGGQLTVRSGTGGTCLRAE
ncbi:MAG: PAS domain-containing sensor histidine kinase, partial [Steroidobacteraceae bacterium]